MEMGQLRMVDDGKLDGSRAKEAPCFLGIDATSSQQMKNFRENGFGCEGRKAQLEKGIGADFVPAVTSVQDGQNCAGIDQQNGATAACRRLCSSSSATSSAFLASQSRTAESRTADTRIFLRRAARSISDFKPRESRQLLTSVFMHYIVVRNRYGCK